MQPDGLSCSQVVNLLPGFVQPRQLLFFSGLEVDRVFVYLIRTFWYRMSRQIAPFDNVSRSGLSFHNVCIPCYFFVDQQHPSALCCELYPSLYVLPPFCRQLSFPSTMVCAGYLRLSLIGGRLLNCIPFGGSCIALCRSSGFQFSTDQCP